jgi:aspartyl-tRNA(Asn)/glutamyl-tRNA(Gln) amidotransferase subunit B
MEKGVMRFEANVSIRPAGSDQLGTRVEIKNLNSFRAMERAIAYELARQASLLENGETVSQETLGWDEPNQRTYVQRSKEEAHDYRYFPEPDIPPLVVERDWIEQIRQRMPELPRDRTRRLQQQYGLAPADAAILTSESEIAAYFEDCAAALKQASARSAANWITGELFAHLNLTGAEITHIRVSPQSLAGLLDIIEAGGINQNTAKTVLAEMLASGSSAQQVISEKGLAQVTDTGFISDLVKEVLTTNQKELASYLAGKETLANWFFGQVMRAAGGKASPAVLKEELEKQLAEARRG